MVHLSRYWEIRIVDAGSAGTGCKTRTIPNVRDFFQQQFPELAQRQQLSDHQNRNIQVLLLSWFRPQLSAIDVWQRLQSGFCLRCYVSDYILKACIDLQRQFGAGNKFTYQELLPFVLNDDGKLQVILDDRDQVLIDDRGKLQLSSYKIFAVEIIKRFNLTSTVRLSLAKWAYYQTRQNSEIKDFLWQQGLRLLSDWALLNKARVKQLEWSRDRAILETFHTVYRRDRRLAAHNRSKICPDPTNGQMQEMLAILAAKNIRIDSSTELMKELKKLGQLVRQSDIRSSQSSAMEVPLEFADPESGNYITIDLPDSSSAPNLEEIEQEELQLFLDRQLLECLNRGIEQGISDRINDLRQRPRYAALAVKIKPGFRLYCQGKSQTEIATFLGMTSQSQVSRVLEPKDLLSKVRFRTVEKLLEIILDKARELGLISIAPQPDYLDNLIHQIEAFVDEKVFHLAAAEIASGQKNRPMDSLYAQQLRYYLDSCSEDI